MDYLDLFKKLPKYYAESMEMTENNEDAQNPTLYHYDGSWVVDWIDSDSCSEHVEHADTPEEAIQKAYDWAKKNIVGFEG